MLQDLKEDAEQKKQDEGFQKPHTKVNKKALRTSDETPTYTGGVSDEARNRLEHRHNRDKQRKFQITTKVLLLYPKSCRLLLVIQLFHVYSLKMIDIGMKAPNLNVLVTGETIEALERIANVPDGVTTAGKRQNSGTNLQHPKFTSRGRRPGQAGMTMIYPSLKDGKKIKQSVENDEIRPTVDRPNVETDEADQIGLKEVIDAVLTGLKEEIDAVLTGLREGIDEIRIDPIGVIGKAAIGPKGFHTLITSKQASFLNQID